MSRPFTVEHKKIPKPKDDYHIRAVLKKSAIDLPHLAAHPYDQKRLGMAPLAFAEYVLHQQGLVGKIAGADFIDGKYATPLVKIRSANAVLKRLGLKQLTGDPSWMV